MKVNHKDTKAQRRRGTERVIFIGFSLNAIDALDGQPHPEPITITTSISYPETGDNRQKKTPEQVPSF